MSADVDPSDLSAVTPALDKTVDEAVVAGAVAGVATASRAGHEHGPVNTHCENCGTKLEGPFCHRCGQHDYPVHRSFRHAVHEALENLFHFEGKFFQNVLTLLFRPGGLTAAFNAGKRASQMPPFRLYLFVSVLFFVGYFPRHALVPGSGWNLNTADVQLDLSDGDRTPDAANSHARSAAAREQSEKLRHFLERVTSNESRQRIVAEFIHSLPKLLLLALPLLALYTRVLFRGSGQVYLQHLVMSFHFHTFVYLWVMFSSGWTGLIGLMSPGLAWFVDTLCSLWLAIYPVWMLRRLYGNSWGKTVAKTALLTLVYGFTLGAIFVTGFVLLIIFE